MKFPLLGSYILALSLSASASTPCKPSQLIATDRGGTAGGWHSDDIYLRNSSHTTCSARGFPHLTLFDKKGRVIKKIGLQKSNQIGSEEIHLQPAHSVLLKPGESAEFSLMYGNGIGLEDEERDRTCPIVDHMYLRLPSFKKRLAIRLRPCGTISVTAVQKKEPEQE